VVLQTTSTQRSSVYDNSSCTQNAFIINSQNGGGGQLCSGQSIDFGIFLLIDLILFRFFTMTVALFSDIMALNQQNQMLEAIRCNL